VNYYYIVTLQWVVDGRHQRTSTRNGTVAVPAGATRGQVVAAAISAASAAMGAGAGAVTVFLDVQPDEL
jgi:DnaJ-class molecular chaperone